MTAQKATTKVVVLWESELRIAAAACRRFLSLPADTPQEMVGEVAGQLINACSAALWDADDPEAAVVVSRAPEFPKHRRKPEVQR